jgi:hypothetical protein
VARAVGLPGADEAKPADSRLGQALLGRNGSNGEARPAVLTAEERELLRRVLAKVDDGPE